MPTRALAHRGRRPLVIPSPRERKSWDRKINHEIEFAMPTLPDDLRNRLEKAVIAARDKAEEGARAALQRLCVDVSDSKKIPKNFSPENRNLRNHLRAHARQLGDLDA